MLTIIGLLMVLYALYQSALIYGAVVGFLALGFRLTQESSGYMNLGYSVNLGIGMAFGFIVIQQLNIIPILGAPSSFILTGLFNVLVYTLFYRRMELRNYSEALIALFGLVSIYIAENGLTVVEYLMRISFPSEYWCGQAPIRFSSQHLHYRVSSAGFFIDGLVEILVIFSVIILLFRWIYYTKHGALLRAVGENPSLVEVSGISSLKIKTYAWFIAGGLAGIAGIISPYIMKGEMGRDVQLLFVPMVVASILAEKREPWIAGLVGMFIGFAHLILLTWGQQYIGVWVGEYWSVVPQIFLVIVLSMKDRKLQIPSWLNPRRQ